MLKGVFTPMITAFDAEGRLDYPANAALIERLITGGVNGILFMGSIGEFFSLSVAEKQDFTDFVVKTVNKRVTVMIGTGGTHVDEVIALTRYAEKAGADCGVAISPYYFKLDEDSIYRYYAAIANASPLPLLLYNFPDRSNVDFSANLVRSLAVDFPQIIGIKDTVDNISHTRKLIAAVKPARADFAILSGFDEYLIPNLMAGGDGLIGGLSNLIPQTFSDLYRAYQSGDFAGVTVAQARISALMALYDVTNPFVLAIKTAVSRSTGLCTGAMRKPAGSVTEAQIQSIDQLIQGIQ